MTPQFARNPTDAMQCYAPVGPKAGTAFMFCEFLSIFVEQFDGVLERLLRRRWILAADQAPA